MSDNSPTDSGNDQSSSGSQNEEPLLDKDTNQSAEEQQDTVSGEQSQDAGQSSEDEPQDKGTTQSQDSSDADDDGLAKFAKSQGFDYGSLTDNEKKALKIAHDNQKAFRKERQDAGELTKTLEDAHEVSQDELDDMDPMEARIARNEAETAKLRASQKVSDFYNQNPDARGLEAEMKQLVLDEKEKYGPEAARYLASDLNRLYILAKASRGDNDVETAREAGRREEREELRKKQEGSADGGHAQQTNQTPPKVTRDWIDNEYDPSNEEHRNMLDEAINRGDLY